MITYFVINTSLSTLINYILIMLSSLINYVQVISYLEFTMFLLLSVSWYYPLSMLSFCTSHIKLIFLELLSIMQVVMSSFDMNIKVVAALLYNITKVFNTFIISIMATGQTVLGPRYRAMYQCIPLDITKKKIVVHWVLERLLIHYQFLVRLINTKCHMPVWLVF